MRQMNIFIGRPRAIAFGPRAPHGKAVNRLNSSFGAAFYIRECRFNGVRAMRLVQLTMVGQAAVPVFINPDQVVSLVALSDRTQIVTTATTAHGAAIIYDVTELAAEVMRLLTTNPAVAPPGRA